MSRQLVPFGAEHVAPAARLLASRHARDRERRPEMPPRFEAVESCLPLVEALQAGGCGVVAVDEHGEPNGFLLAVLPALHEPHRRGRVPLEGHAAAPGREYELYRDMYAALAPELVRRGVFDHQVMVPTDDAATVQAWFSLGFGQWVHVAYRDLHEASGGADPFEISAGGPAELEDIQRLFVGLIAHDTASPMFMPYVFDETGYLRAIDKAVSEPGRAFWLAREGGRVVGLMYLGEPEEEGVYRPEGSAHLWEAFVQPAARRRGLGRALFARSVAWARENGYTGLTLDFRSFNIAASRFWRSQGFRPVASVLERRIDPRIAWARETSG